VVVLVPALLVLAPVMCLARPLPVPVPASTTIPMTMPVSVLVVLAFASFLGGHLA
jgi:hypothetical protein